MGPWGFVWIAISKAAGQALLGWYIYKRFPEGWLLLRVKVRPLQEARFIRNLVPTVPVSGSQLLGGGGVEKGGEWNQVWTKATDQSFYRQWDSLFPPLKAQGSLRYQWDRSFPKHGCFLSTLLNTMCYSTAEASQLMRSTLNPTSVPTWVRRQGSVPLGRVFLSITEGQPGGEGHPYSLPSWGASSIEVHSIGCRLDIMLTHRKLQLSVYQTP